MMLIVLLYAILAMTFIAAKYAVSFAQPIFLIGFRMICAGIGILTYQRIRYGAFSIRSQDYVLFFKTTMFHIYCAFILEFWALQYVSALKTTIFYSLSPFITAILAYFLLQHSITMRKWIAIIIGFIGLLPIFIVRADAHEVASLLLFSVPDCVMLLAVTSSAYAWFLVKRLMQHYDLLLINGISMLCGGILSLATSLIVEGCSAPVSDWSLFLVWIFVLIILSNVIAYNLYGYLLHHYSITLLSFAGFLCPLFTALFDCLLGNTVLTWHYVVAFFSVTIGLYLFYHDAT